jgi:hypothetical protein
MDILLILRLIVGAGIIGYVYNIVRNFESALSLKLTLLVVSCIIFYALPTMLPLTFGWHWFFAVCILVIGWLEFLQLSFAISVAFVMGLYGGFLIISNFFNGFHRR